MNKYTKIAAVVAGTLMSSSAFSATWVADARGNAMGNTGVTTADFVTAPFYNPALTAVYRDEDDFGLLLPAVNINARDTDDSLTTIDDIQSLIDEIEQYESDPSTADLSVISRLDSKLDELSDDAPLGITAGLGIAVALPINKLSVNLYSRSYLELLIDQDIAASTVDETDGAAAQYTDITNRVDAAYVDLLAFGYTEVGLAFAKQFNIYNQQVSFGITPKMQKMVTYKQHVTVDSFDEEEYDENETSKDAFNLDLGAVWLKDKYRVGVVVKDLFKQEIDTYDGADSYTLEPQVTVSAGYIMDYFTAAIDVDLTEQERFSTSADNTQFVRLGVEGNAWGWAQLRAGYEIDTVGTLDNAITAGIGISPGDIVSLDIAGSYAGENQLGGSVNLALTF